MRKTWPPQVGEGAVSRGCQTLRSWKKKEMFFFPDLSLKKNQPCRHLDWSPVRSSSDS